MNKNQKIIKTFLIKEFKKFPHTDLLDEGVLDRMGARVAGAWSKGLSGDESRSIAKKVQRIISTHRKEMESDFAKLDITDTPAVEQVLDAMRKMENAAKQYLGGEKARSGGYVTKQGDAAPPIDTNNDGKPDAQDIDGDGEPEVFDTDGDGQIDSQDTDGDGEPDAKVQDTDGDGKPDVGTTVNVYKGKGGKGLRSTLDKLKLEPALSNAILKTVAAQLKDQGVNVLEEDEELDEMSNAKPARRPRRPRIQNKPPGFEDMLNVGDEEAASAHAKSSKPVAIKQRRGTDAAGNKIMPAGSKPPVRPPPAKAAPKTPAPATAPPASPPAAKSSSGPKVNLGGKGGVRWQLAQAGVRGSQLSQIVKAIQDWAKSSNLEINEGQLLKDLSDELITESRFNRWRRIAGLLRS